VATLKVFCLKSYNINTFWYTTFFFRLSLEMMLMMHHHGDARMVYMTSQLKKCGCKILEKVKFSQMDNPSAISSQAHM